MSYCLVVKRWNWSSWYKALYKRRPKKIKSLDCPRSDHNMHLQEAYRCQGTTHFKWYPLMPVSSWHTPPFLLLPSSLAYNIPTPDMGLTSTPPVSIWGYEFWPSLKTTTLIVPPPFNYIHLNHQPDITLTPNYSSNCLPWAPNQNHSIPPISMTVLTTIPSWYDLPTSYEVLPVFLCTKNLDT